MKMVKIMPYSNSALLTTFIIVVGLVNFGHCWTWQSLPNFGAAFTEDLHWRSPNLYLADFGNGHLRRFDTTTNTAYTCQIENTNEVAFIVPQSSSDKLFVVGTRHSAVEIEWDGISPVCSIRRTLYQVETNDQNDLPHCLLEGKCDAKGRLFSGTANCKEDLKLIRQHLFKFSNGQVEILRNDVNISNGIAFNDQRNELYHIDSGANTITRFKYDVGTGVATNPETVFRLDSSAYPPNPEANFDVLDSMTTDSNGFIYATVFGGKRVLKISPDTWQIMDIYELPCAFLTSITFGGPNMDILYVGSALHFFHNATFAKPCGDTFQLLDTGARGVQESPCALN